MTEHRRGVALTPMETRREVILRTALLAEELGYELCSVSEGWGLDSVPLLTEIALRTRRIRVASGILSVWGRTPATLAMTAATLHEVSGGRFVLGLGASTRALVEGFHGARFVHVADRLHATVSRVRALLAGEAPGSASVPDARPLRLGLPPAPEVPIWLAALGPRSMRGVADLADGWLPFCVAPQHVRAWGEDLKATGSRPLTIAAGPFVVADDEPAAARLAVASMMAWYVTAMGEVYGRSLSRHGYAAEVEVVRSRNPRPHLKAGVIPPEAERLLDDFAAYGTGSQVSDRLERWDDVADITTIVCPPAVPWHMLEATLRAAAPVPVGASRGHRRS